MSLDTERLMDFWPALLGVMRNRLPRHPHAVWEDLASDTIERAILNQHRYIDRGNGPYSWLTVMASHIATDYLRRHMNRAENALPLAEYGHATLDAGSERHLAAVVVNEALSRVDAASRHLLVGHHHEGRSLRELCPDLQPQSGGQSKRHAAALANLRGLLGGVA